MRARTPPSLSRRALLRHAFSGAVIASAPVILPRTADALRPDSPPSCPDCGGEDVSPAGTARLAPPGAPRAARSVGLSIHHRADWAADEALRAAPPSFAPVQKLVVHHTDTEGRDPVAEIDAIYRYHVLGRGFADIAYNFLVDPSGTIWEGRWAREYGPDEVHDGEDGYGHGVIGGHTLHWNTGSCGIALLGNYDQGPISEAALRALVGLLTWKASAHGIDPLGAATAYDANGQAYVFPNICAHGDLRITACPGGGIRNTLALIRDLVHDRVAKGVIGHRVLLGDGRLVHLGAALAIPDAAPHLHAPAVAMAAGPGPEDVWVLSEDGGVYALGGAPFHGAPSELGAHNRFVDIAATPSLSGYWTLADDGSVFTFGDAVFAGSVGDVTPGRTAIALAPTPTGHGYLVLCADGDVLGFGDAVTRGAIVTGAGAAPADLVMTSSGRGYWVLTTDGIVHAFGDASRWGDARQVGDTWVAPARALMVAPGGSGYQILAGGGGLFSFGTCPWFGSASGVRPDAVGCAAAVQR